MTRLMDAWNRYWFKPSPLFDLAFVRIVSVVLQLLVLTIFRNRTDTIERLVSLSEVFFEPLLLFRLFSLPFGSTFRLSSEAIWITYWVILVLGVFALLGLRTNLSLLGFSLGNLFYNSFFYSFGEFHHPEAIMMITLFSLSLSPCGRVLSIDSLLNRRKAKSSDRSQEIPIWELKSIYARWPLLLIQWMYGLMYLSSFSAKLYRSGFAWANGYTLQYNLLNVAERPLPSLGIWLGQQHGLAVLLSWITLLFEGTFLLVPLFPRLAWIYVPIGIGTHLSILLFMGPDFYEFIGLYVVFIPWSNIFKWASSVTSRFSRGVQTSIQPDGAGNR